jgi:hypothetical protein
MPQRYNTDNKKLVIPVLKKDRHPRGHLIGDLVQKTETSD